MKEIDIIDDESVDLISMNDMIEHLFDPKTFLMQCRTKLVSDGALSIACPNGEGFDYQLMKEMTVNITPPEHLNYFNPNSLSFLLERTGFKVVSIETPGILDVQIVKRALQQNCSKKFHRDCLSWLVLDWDI
jgi:predicted SAM-dependent methyltransferase